MYKATTFMETCSQWLSPGTRYNPSELQAAELGEERPRN